MTLKSIAGRARRAAFTLIEMLLVVAIIGILMSLAVPYMFGAITASRLTASGESIAGMFSSALQIASSEGCTVEVRLYKSPRPGNSGDHYHTIVLFQHYERGEPNPDPNPANSGRPLTAPMAVVLGDAIALPDSLVISANTSASSLVNALPTVAGTVATKIMRGSVMGDYDFPYSGATYKSFLFRSDGTNLDPDEKWFLTIVESNDEDANRAPADWKNFFCIQVDPTSGMSTVYRP